MPRGTGSNWRYDEAQLQKRVWAPWTLLPALWYGANNASYRADSFGVNTLIDQVGDDGNLTQVTNANKPSLEVDPLTGRFVLGWSSSGRWLLGTPSRGWSPTAVTLCTLITQGSSTTQRFISRRSNLEWPRTNYLIDVSNTLGASDVRGATIVAAVGGSISVGQRNIIVSRHTSGIGIETRINGTQVSAASSTLSINGTAEQRFVIGVDALDLITLPVLAGSCVHETIVFTSSISLQVEGYLAWGWSTQSILPASHPFRNRPPMIGD